MLPFFFAVLALGVVLGAILEAPRLVAFRDHPAMLGENHVKMTVPDVDDATKWYEENLGFSRLSVVQKDDHKTHVLLARESNMLELMDGQGAIGPVSASAVRSSRSGIAGPVPLRFSDVMRCSKS